jgi:nucleotide-binding universal stress UspA family protein
MDQSLSAKETSARFHGSVVVGLTTTPASRAAFRWASDYARRTGARLSVVCVHPAKDSQPTEVSVPDVKLDWSAQARRTIDLEFSSSHPESGWTLTQLIGEPGPELVRAAENAQLLVIGRHHMAPHRPGSPVAAYCAETATVPVVIVPPPQDAHLGPNATASTVLQANC